MNLISGLDVGSSSVKFLVAEKNEDSQELEILAKIQEPSLGIRRGVVVDVEKVSQTIKSLLEKVRMETGHKIESAFVNISGSHLFCTSSRGTVAVSRADQRISDEDVDRVLQAAQTFSLPLNKEILEVYPKEFIVDGERRIKEVVGMQGVRLETEVLVLAAFSPYVKNLTQAVLNSGLQILDVIPSPLASSFAVLDERQKELGVAILSIGGGVSELAVFEEGDLIHLALFPMGSANITNDIAIGLKSDIDTAEMVKVNFGSLMQKSSSKKERLEVEGEDPIVFSRKMLSKIIEARVSDILGEVKKELEKIGKESSLPAGIVIVGGGSKLPKIVEFTKKELKLPCRLGQIKAFSNFDDDLSWSTACGLVLRNGNIGGEVFNETFSLPVKDFGAKLKKFLKVFIP